MRASGALVWKGWEEEGDRTFGSIVHHSWSASPTKAGLDGPVPRVSCWVGAFFCSRKFSRSGMPPAPPRPTPYSSSLPHQSETNRVHASKCTYIIPETATSLSRFVPQSIQGKPFCTCWVHNAFVNVDGEKMSKSKGNFLTLSGTLPTALDVRAFRYLVVSSQYRTTLGFSGKSLEGAKNTLKRLDKLRVRAM